MHMRWISEACLVYLQPAPRATVNVNIRKMHVILAVTIWLSSPALLTAHTSAPVPHQRVVRARGGVPTRCVLQCLQRRPAFAMQNDDGMGWWCQYSMATSATWRHRKQACVMRRRIGHFRCRALRVACDEEWQRTGGGDASTEKGGYSLWDCCRRCWT